MPIQYLSNQPFSTSTKACNSLQWSPCKMPLLPYPSHLALDPDLCDTCLAQLTAINGPWIDRGVRIDGFPIIILTPNCNDKATTNAPSIARARLFPHLRFEYVFRMGFMSGHFFSAVEVINFLTNEQNRPLSASVYRPAVNGVHVVPSC